MLVFGLRDRLTSPIASTFPHSIRCHKSPEGGLSPIILITPTNREGHPADSPRPSPASERCDAAPARPQLSARPIGEDCKGVLSSFPIRTSCCLLSVRNTSGSLAHDRPA